MNELYTHIVFLSIGALVGSYFLKMTGCLWILAYRESLKKVLEGSRMIMISRIIRWISLGILISSTLSILIVKFI